MPSTTAVQADFIFAQQDGPRPAEDPVTDFWRFVVERHEIFIRRHIEHRPPPWTTDPWLRIGRYTHIYRDLDRVTRWLRVHVVEGAALDASDLAFANPRIPALLHA